MDAAERRAARGDRRTPRSPATGRDAPTRCWPTLGWLEMLAAEPRDAIDVVFDALGATQRARRPCSTTWSSRRSASSAAPTSRCCSRRSARGTLPGHVGDGRLHARRARDGARRDRARAAGRVRRPDRSSAWSRVPRVGRVTAGAGHRSRRGLPRRARSSTTAGARRRSTPARGSRRVASGRRAVAHADRWARAGRCSTLARTHAFGAGAVRPADRVVPSRSAPARRRARRDRGARGDAAARPPTSRRRSPRRSPRPRPAAPRARSRRIASRCSPGSASRPTTRSTASSSGRCCSKACSDRPTRSRSTSAGTCSRRAACRRSSSCEAPGANPMTDFEATRLRRDRLLPRQRVRRRPVSRTSSTSARSARCSASRITTW